MPRSSALCTTVCDAALSIHMPKLLQPRPTSDTRRPEGPRLRCSMEAPSRVVSSWRGLRRVGGLGRRLGAEADAVAAALLGGVERVIGGADDLIEPHAL